MEKIAMSQDEKNVVVEFHFKKLEDLYTKLVEINNEIEMTKARLSVLGVDVTKKFEHEDKYSQTWPLSQRTAYILKKENKVLIIRNIVDKMEELEETRFSPFRKKDIANKLASTLKQKVDKQEMFARTSNNGMYYYGLIEWVGEDEKIQDKYL